MVLLDFSMSPLGQGESVAAYVARCLEIVAQSGLDYRLHAMGTTLEGEWDDVFAVVNRCFAALQADCNRISVSIKVDYRKGPERRLESKVRHVGRGFPLDQPAFTGLEVERSEAGNVVLSEALAYLDCSVVARHPAGDHDLFIARTVGGKLLGEGTPMVHVRKSGLHY